MLRGVGMNDSGSDEPISQDTHDRLRDLHRRLLHLHKTLLDSERDAYEQQRGSVTSGQLLQLLMTDEHFDWLRTFSKFIVSIDEMLAAKPPASAADANELLERARRLFNPAEEGNEFERRYFEALQRDPNAIFEHRDLRRMLSS
jgi:hypothetical protein